jgi:trans-aconitate methyltransferase
VSATLGLMRRLRRTVLNRVFERSEETNAIVRLDELGLARSGYHDYEPSGWRSLSRALRGLDIGSSETFIDIGCGKGRVVAQASRRPFGRVLGVELSEELAEQARRLTDSERRRQRCGSVEIMTADVTTWQMPDDVTIVYINNALSGAALHAMLDRISESVSRAPRRLLLLYVHPLHETDVTQHPSFDLLRRRGSRRWSATDPRRISIFQARL